ncbi:MAG: S8 family serine peptidase [Gramella sp.]|nr:S8 family serine peptidase [Christiangramia sp.]
MKILLLFAFFISFSTVAQEEHAWIYFKDKPHAQQALEDPYSILSAKAIERKKLRNTPIDARDVPVHDGYISTLKAREGIVVKAKSKWLNCVHVLGTLEDISELSSLDFVSSIEYANKNLTNRTSEQFQVVANKLETNTDFVYGPAENQVQMLNTDFLHENDFTGEGLTIAVMDAGFPNVNTLEAFARLRSKGKLLGGYNFPDRSNNIDDPSLSAHGTLVLATMAASLEARFTGTAPDASYYLFRTEIGPTETPVEESYWVEAAERADSLGVDIINTSLGYTSFDNPDYSYTPEAMNGITTFISRGANIATEKGILVINSAGNRGDEEYFNIISAPADANVLTIGAVDKDRNYALFSSTGPSTDNRIKPDLAAQGLEIVTVDEFDNLVTVSGTSFSSPILAGSAASLWQVNPSWTNLELMEILRKSGSQFQSPDDLLGYGIPDLAKAFKEFENKKIEIDEFTFFPNPVQNVLSFVNPDSQDFDVTIYDTLGQKLLHKKKVQNQIDLTGFSSGIYIVMFEQNNSRNSFLILKE